MKQNLLMVLNQLTYVFQTPFNRLLILTVGSQVFSMFTKVIITFVRTKSFSLKNMTKYGGMPSSHTAFITALLFGVALDPAFGWKHPFFTFALVLSCIVLIDAISLRGNIDRLNDVVKELLEKDKDLKNKIILPKKIAHTVPEVIGGIIFALIYTILFYTFFFNIFPT